MQVSIYFATWGWSPENRLQAIFASMHWEKQKFSAKKTREIVTVESGRPGQGCMSETSESRRPGPGQSQRGKRGRDPVQNPGEKLGQTSKQSPVYGGQSSKKKWRRAHWHDRRCLVQQGLLAEDGVDPDGLARPGTSQQGTWDHARINGGSAE